MASPHINIVVKICEAHAIEHAVISPGSRNAPLTISFSNSKSIQCHVIPDERSAGFIALGMAQASGKPTILICTSGTAGLNYFPAIAEAKYSHTPLLIFTADRPAEWIDQYDGQAIRQQNMFGQYARNFYQFPDDLNHPDKLHHGERMVNEAIINASRYHAPVHINFPFREPFYPTGNNVDYDGKPTFIQYHTFSNDISEKAIKEKIGDFNFGKVLFIPGQGIYNSEVKSEVENLIKAGKLVCIGDVTSNFGDVNGVIRHCDLWLREKFDDGALIPDLVLTTGGSLVSKNLKLFLRKNSIEHWHISQNEDIPDTFSSLKNLFHCDLNSFISILSDILSVETQFSKAWSAPDIKAGELLQNFLVEESHYGEFQAVEQLTKKLLKRKSMHLFAGNSMPVRYLNFINVEKGNVQIHANRGTSGIDGSLSTAVGHSHVNKNFNVVILGDMSFLYDSNALWNHLNKDHLCIIILNNAGGGIFRIIDGSGELPQLEEYFEAKHNRDASNVAADFYFDYHRIETPDELKKILKLPDEKFNRSIIEVFSESGKNASLLKEIKIQMKNKLS